MELLASDMGVIGDEGAVAAMTWSSPARTLIAGILPLPRVDGPSSVDVSGAAGSAIVNLPEAWVPPRSVSPSKLLNLGRTGNQISIFRQRCQ